MLPSLNPLPMKNWLRNRNTIEFLGIWGPLNNPAFKPVEFDGFKQQAGLNRFTLTPKQWIEQTAAICDNPTLEALTVPQISFVYGCRRSVLFM